MIDIGIDHWGKLAVAITPTLSWLRLNIDNVTITPKEECKEAHERKLAEVRLRKTSAFEPDFEVKMAAGLWGYNYHLEELVYADAGYVNYGEPVRATGETLKGLLKKIEQIG